MTTWKIDPSHSNVHFWVRHMVISKVHGNFRTFEGTIDLDEKNVGSSKVNVSIDAKSISTNEDKRDAHLASPDFLDAEKFPKITFVSRSIEGTAEKARVLGDLTVHGVTKPVTLDAELTGRGKDPWGNQRVAFEAKTSIDRKDFGLVWNQNLDAGGLLVGDKVDIQIELEAIGA